MKGKVTTYFDEKGYGFVYDENGEKRFFHISDVIDDVNELTRGSQIEFTPSQNEKGLNCLKINVLNRKQSHFITIGNTNIKISNIKEYGISTNYNYIKAIKVPVFEIDPNYISKREKVGRNPLKWLMLPAMYRESEKYTEIPISEFSKLERPAPNFGKYKYYLPYKMVNKGRLLVADYETTGFEINEDRAEKVYMKYLYISTYQNDNYKFYENEINIEESIIELKELTQ